MAKKIFMIFIAGVVILLLFFVFYYTTKADTRDIIFHLNDSLAGSTFFHWLNLF